MRLPSLLNKITALHHSLSAMIQKLKFGFQTAEEPTFVKYMNSA